MNVAIIPARGGSQRIPRKNIRDFCGKPMIAWSILAAQKSGCFGRIIVSTDDPEIADVAKVHGAEVPFLRPAALSDHHTPTIPVIRHAINWLVEHENTPDYICCLYATAPFVTADLINEGLKKLKTHDETEFVFTATEFNFPIWRSLRMNTDGSTAMNWPEHELTRSQDLPSSYHDAGQFYWGTAEAYLKNDGIFSSRCRLCRIPSYRVQDIDTEEDWRRAELAFDVIQKDPLE